MIKPPKGWKFDPFADVRMGRSLFDLRAEDWLVPDDTPEADYLRSQDNG